MENSSASPFSLTNFLAYGTISVCLRPDALDQLHHECQADPMVAQDGWNGFSADLLLKSLGNTEDYSLIREMEFLIREKFLYASYWVKNDSLLIRIYLIPYDLPGVQGRLRVRTDNILGPARRYLSSLLPKISRSPDSWQAICLSVPPPAPPGTTLSEIYETLPSPQLQVTPASTPVTERLLDVSDDLSTLGLRSTLRKYQRRSVAAMVQEEMDLHDDPDPLFVPVVGLTYTTMWLQPGTMELLLERPRVAPCRGGILCEELGTGKTVIILALVMSTLRHISEPAPSILDTRPVLTPLAFRHFPSTEFGMARTRNKGKFYPNTSPRVPRLAELLLHRMATKPLTFIPECSAEYHASLQKEVDDLDHYTGPRKDNIPFYIDYQGEPKDNERTDKRPNSRQAKQGPRLLYLTSATIIVVPTNLLMQWETACSVHCDDSLRVCVLREQQAMPPARELASHYDIVLMTYSRFTAAENTKKGDWTWKGCKCPEYPGVRVPRCVCKPPQCSPLLQIRWKRLVIDEGHVSSSTSTELNRFMRILSVERRWIVTGTPTTNLLGLNLGKNMNETFASPSQSSNELPSRAPSEGPESDQFSVVDDLSAPRVWDKDDGEDLTKLGNMITYFLRVPQLLANPKIISTHIKDALLDKRGPRPGAIEVLKQLMSSVMIRHQIADVETEVKLPPVTQELVLLDLDPLMIKSYNALQAIIAVNAVQSERKDKDYMFHASNTEHLRLTVQNISQILFYRISEDYYNIDELLRNSAEATKNKVPASASLQDLQLLNDALHHLELAAADPLWRALQAHEDVAYRLYDLKRSIFEAWSRTAQSVDPNDASLCGYIHPDRLRALRMFVLAKPLTSEEALVELGKYTAEQDAQRRKAYEESLKGRKSRSARNPPESTSQIKANQAAKKAAEPSVVKEMQQELENAVRRSAGLDTPMPHIPLPSYVGRMSPLVSSSPIASTQVGSSASSKLNFIINEVLEYSPKEKFLIFSDSELSLAHISEALDLAGVDFLRFGSQIPARVREQTVLTFETSERYRVFLMELKHGARGLNLISASRVIFCEPVWRADVESQAIKRCHRIGQLRPISVKTLAIRGTAEETMAARRLELKDKTDKLPELIKEKGMRDFIANPKFITHVPTNLPTVKILLVKLAPQVNDLDTTMYDIDDSATSPPHRVRFTDGESPIAGPSLKRKSTPDSPGVGEQPFKRTMRLIVAQSHSPRASAPKPRPKVRFDVP
ncbi:SNF2 family N-terminal domain-containing protein [Mycena maculata]|uniref:SNF2 family N-terminal domain-containing protein n=1 Tax=Mycena maculata TaxID=230809 RepID=A0AAD7NSC7_9AGAR|nr:SNF2 family N-terminal domain-containing protein [Mycena maculata]